MSPQLRDHGNIIVGAVGAEPSSLDVKITPSRIGKNASNSQVSFQTPADIREEYERKRGIYNELKHKSFSGGDWIPTEPYTTHTASKVNNAPKWDFHPGSANVGFPDMDNRRKKKTITPPSNRNYNIITGADQAAWKRATAKRTNAQKFEEMLRSREPPVHDIITMQ